MDRVVATERLTARRLLRDLRFPLVAYVVWRVAQEVVLQSVGGQLRGTLFNWDGSWYHALWKRGYDYEVPSGRTTNFFPLLSWVTRAVNVVIRNDEVAGTVVITAGAVAAVCLVYLVFKEWRGEQIARWGVTLMLLFPASFFLRQFYSEGFFVALSAGALLFHTRRRPWLAAVFAFGATMTRVPGVAVVLAIVASAWLEDRRVTPRMMVPLLGLLGFVPVLVAQGIEAGNPVDFISASEAWGRHLDGPWYPFITGWRAIRAGGPYVETASYDLLAVVFVAAATAVAFMKRWPWPARLFMLAMLAIPITQHFVSSLARYMLAAWPAFAVTAEWLVAQPRRMQIGVGALLVVASMLFIRLAHLGAFVG